MHHEQESPASSVHHDGHPMLPHHDAAEAPVTAPAGHSDHESGETPAPLDCCQALASCAAGAEMAEMFVAANGLPRDDAIGVLIDIPLSRVTAPDPPPPKA